MRRQSAGRRRGAFDRNRDHIDIEQYGKIGGYDLQQLLETRCGEDRDRRLVHPALACQIAAAGGNQGTVFEVYSRQVAAQPLDVEMLEIDDMLAELPARRAQQAQRIGMTIEEIGMAAQIV